MEPRKVNALFPNGNNYEWAFRRQLDLEGYIVYHAKLVCVTDGLPATPYGFW